jgi:membrane protein implicated in regulation of membrane protease activity
MSTALWIWLALAVIFVILEIFAPGFIFACFVAGSVAAGLTSLITDSYIIQGIVFAVVSLIIIYLTRPLAQKITRPSPVNSNVDALIGRVGIVKNDVSMMEGQVTVDEQVWQARSEIEIAAGKKIKVLAVEGAKLRVEEIE